MTFILSTVCIVACVYVMPTKSRGGCNILLELKSPLVSATGQAQVLWKSKKCCFCFFKSYTEVLKLGNFETFLN